MPFKSTDKLVAIGASTGGADAIQKILLGLPPDFPGIVIAQHIPEAFGGPFAQRMNRLCPMVVAEARGGDQIIPGHCYIAPGGRHLIVVRDGASLVCQVNDGPPVNQHRPSLEVLFRSVAQNLGSNAIGVILTGMGTDGAAGLKEMREAGAFTLAQDETTSVVWAMPGEAVKLGGVDEILALEKIAPRLVTLVRERAARLSRPLDS